MKKIKRKIIRVIKTLTLVIIICVNSIIVISNNNDNEVNAAEFHLRQELPVNAAEFFFGGE